MSADFSNRKWDGHTHTPFCRHGERSSFAAYIEQAIQLGFSKYTLTEHPPLPEHWIRDQKVMDFLAMPMDDLPRYVREASLVKERFAGTIEISLGLELDYLADQEWFTDDILNRCDGRIEEAIVSVHFLRGVNGMRCVDYSSQDWKEGLLQYYGKVERVVDHYYDQVEEAIRFADRLSIPTRIGHLALIKKFQNELPTFDEEQIEERLRRLLPLLKFANVGIDANVAGLRTPTCQQPYVPAWFLQEAARLKIPAIFGSDAHRPSDVGHHWDWFEDVMWGGDGTAGC